MNEKPVTLGVIVGNRGFFPSHLCEDGRAIILEVLEQEGIKAIAISADETSYGSVESLEEARKLAELFKAHADEIDGVLVTLPNFGDERAIANTLRWAGLNVPVLIHAYPDVIETMTCDRNHDDQRSPRLILRQDVGLQQPAPIWHQVHADQPAHSGS